MARALRVALEMLVPVAPSAGIAALRQGATDEPGTVISDRSVVNRLGGVLEIAACAHLRLHRPTASVSTGARAESIRHAQEMNAVAAPRNWDMVGCIHGQHSHCCRTGGCAPAAPPYNTATSDGHIDASETIRPDPGSLRRKAFITPVIALVWAVMSIF